MPYIPHNEDDTVSMLEKIGVSSIDELFEAIPEKLRLKRELKIPSGISEYELELKLRSLASKNKIFELSRSFAGGGIYPHYVPATVEELSARSEFYTSYTPYQPEVSQGMLQAVFEYQSFVCILTGMEASNASSYDGATALADAVIMAKNISRKHKVLLPPFLNPQYRQVLQTYNLGMELELISLGYDEDGCISRKELVDALEAGDVGAVILQVPNFLGFYEEGIAGISELAHNSGAVVIMCVYPFCLAVMKSPSELGADIVVGEGQPLGLPRSFGGPLLGFIATKLKYIRQLPGRIIGLAEAKEGKKGFVMTLQAREQHIRRAKASSNICTNESLAALRFAIYLAQIGRDGFHFIARKCEENAHYAFERLCELKGVKPVFPDRSFFNEFTINLGDKHKVQKVYDSLLHRGWLPGIPLYEADMGFDSCLLLAFTEVHTKEVIDEFVEDFKEALG